MRLIYTVNFTRVWYNCYLIFLRILCYCCVCVSGYSTSRGFVVQNSGYIPLNRTYHCYGNEAGLTNCITSRRSYCFNKNYFPYITVHCKSGPGKYNIHVFDLLILYKKIYMKLI